MLPERGLVLGLARSGEAAALALARRGVRVVGVDRNEELDAGRLRASGVEVVLGAEDPALVDDVDLLVKSPGIPSEAPSWPPRARAGVAIWSEVELGARILAEPAARRHRDEREDDDVRAPRRDLPRRRAGRSPSPGTSGAR